MRRTAAGVLASALALSGAVAAATPANAAAGFALERIAGDNRYETSARVAAEFGVTSGAILASGETGHVVDALSANFLAGVRGVPVLLTTRNSIPADVMARLNALTGAKTVTIVGGTAAISSAVETQLRGMGFTVDRLAGDDRYGTSEAIIRAGGTATSSVGLIASGLSFPDALAGGPLAYKGKHPVFLTAGGRLPADTVDAIRASGVRSVIVLGGTAAVPATVEAQLRDLGVTVVTRLGGAGRSETSRIIADYLIANMGFTNNTFNVASGAPRGEGADALTGAALSGKENRTLLITDNATSAAPVVAFARDRAATLTQVGDLFGGPAAVAVALEQAIEAAGSPAANQTFTVTPNGPATLALVADEASATAAQAAADNRSYSVATPAAGQTHTIQLVPAANVTVAANGSVTFRDADGTNNAGDNVADFPAAADVAARISEVNGVQIAAASQGITATAVPVAGTITFTIEGVAAGSVVPVVYFDAGAAGLQLDANNAPTAAEPFGVGGVTTFTNPAAPTRTVAAGTAIGSVNKTANQFDALNLTFTYDANDTFRIAGLPATLDEFEAVLSTGDTITATYTSNPALSSNFDLVDAAPAGGPTPDVTVGAADGPNSNDVTVTVTVPSGIDAVQIQRATVTNGTAGTYTTVATEPATDDVPGTAGTQVVFQDANLAAGTYSYRVVLVDDGDTGAAGTAVSVTTVTPPPVDATAPTIVDARVGTNAGSAFLLEVGDTFLLAFSEAVAAPTAGDTFRLTDADGTIVDVVASSATRNTGDVTINGTTYGANRVLTVTRMATDVTVVAGTQSGLGIPATITQQAGTTDAAGNQVNISGSADVIVDTEAGTVSSPTTPTDTTPPVFTTTAVAAGSRDLVVNFDEALTCADVAVADYTIRLTGGTTDISPTSVACNGSAVTLTFNAAGTTAFASGQAGVVDAVDGQVVRNLALLDQVDADQVTFTVS